MLKRILSVIAGIATGFVVVFIGDSITHIINPPPAGLNFEDKNAINHYAASIPTYVLVLMLFFWILSSFLGGLVAAKINPDRWKVSSSITGALLMIAAILNMLLIPHPIWMMIASVILYIPAAYLGGKLVAKKN